MQTTSLASKIRVVNNSDPAKTPQLKEFKIKTHLWGLKQQVASLQNKLKLEEARARQNFIEERAMEDKWKIPTIFPKALESSVKHDPRCQSLRELLKKAQDALTSRIVHLEIEGHNFSEADRFIIQKYFNRYV